MACEAPPPPHPFVPPSAWQAARSRQAEEALRSLPGTWALGPGVVETSREPAGPAAGLRGSAPGTGSGVQWLCPLPAFLDDAGAYAIPSGAAGGFSFYLFQGQHATCKGGTHRSWLSPAIHPPLQLHLWELLTVGAARGLCAPESWASPR